MGYLDPILAAYLVNANSQNKAPMEAYMKTRFIFLGIKSPERAKLNQIFFKEYGYPVSNNLSSLIKILWSRPEREFQYFGMELCGKFKNKFHEENLILIEYIIINKSWWDTVDFIASNLAGGYFKTYPAKIKETIARWIKSENMWLRRSALLFQLKYKMEVDEDLLAKNILICKDEDAFFIRKAIGWSLRQYSKYNPEWVKRFVSTHELSPLSNKEALKWLIRNNLG